MKNFLTSKILITLVLFWTNLSAISFEEYKNQQENQYLKYENKINKEYEQYKKAYEYAFKMFKKDLKIHWPEKTPIITSKHKFVEYSKDLKKRKIVNYQEQNIILEVHAKTKKQAKKDFEKMFDDLLKEDVKKAYKNDILEYKVIKKLNVKPKKVKSNQKIISDMINKNQIKKLKNQIKTKNIKKVKYKKDVIFTLNIKLPSRAFLNKAKAFKKNVYKNSKTQKIPSELIYAIIHSESSFNPMARSYVPAFGLMQIVPRTAGRDTYKYLYKKDKLLSASYLYNSSNNIKIGSAYLHIIYYSYLRNIKNPTSRLFCTIASYNTGAGNVSRAFIGNTNINKAAKIINKMSSKQVYKKLLRSLPHDETKHYLRNVYKRTLMYDRLLKKGF